MRQTEIRIDHKSGEKFYLTPISDLHLDSRDCDRRALDALIKERNALPNHRYIGLGDFADWILPDDRKRHAPSNLLPRFASSDHAADDILEYQAEVLSRCNQIDLLAVGNHEVTRIRRGFTNPIKQLCRTTGAAYGGLCGFLRYRFRDQHGGIATLTILYHHGAWFGAQPIPPGALRWCNEAAGGWDLFLFGHNHRQATETRAKLYPQARGSHAVARPQRVVACGTHLLNYQHSIDSAPGYGASRGHAPTAIGAPLLELSPIQHTGQGRASTGRPRREVQVRVTC